MTRRWPIAMTLAFVACGSGGTQAARTTGPDTDAALVQDAAMLADAATAADADAQDTHKPKLDAWDDPDAPPQLCFHEAPPGPHRHVVAADKPKDCPPLPAILAWPTVDGQPPGPPTLQVELGTSDEDTGAFVPYVDGQWAPIVHGVQGGIHVWAAFRTTPPPGAKPGKIAMQVAGRAFLACAPVATELVTSALAHPDATKPGLLTSASANVAGTPVAFVVNDVTPYCGQYVVVELEVRDPTSQAWGRASALLRLWDLKNL